MNLLIWSTRSKTVQPNNVRHRAYFLARVTWLYSFYFPFVRSCVRTCVHVHASVNVRMVEYAPSLGTQSSYAVSCVGLHQGSHGPVIAIAMPLTMAIRRAVVMALAVASSNGLDSLCRKRVCTYVRIQVRAVVGSWTGTRSGCGMRQTCG